MCVACVCACVCACVYISKVCMMCIYANWRRKGSEEDRNCDGNCIKRDLERVGEEWEKS